MLIDARNKKHAAFAHDFRVFDADTGKEIRDVVWADVARGEYGQHQRDRAGKLVLNADRTEIAEYRVKANIELRAR